MGRICQRTKKCKMNGHKVSHANNKTKRYFNVNLQKKRVFIPEKGRYERILISTHGLRNLDKIGIEYIE